MADSNLSPFSVPQGRLFLSLPEVCEVLGVCRSTAETLWRRGQLRTLKLGGRRLVAVSELNRLVSLAQAEPMPASTDKGAE